MTISEAIEYYKEVKPKGEYVLVVEGSAESSVDTSVTLEQAAEKAAKLIDDGMKSSDACKQIAKETNFSKSAIYSELIKERG